MAGETRGAGNHRDPNKPRRKAFQSDLTRSADQAYYRSGDKSVISKRSKDGTTSQAPGTASAKPRRKAVQSDLPQTSDQKYYAAPALAPTKQQLAARARADAQAGRRPAARQAPGSVTQQAPRAAVAPARMAQAPVRAVGSTLTLRIRTKEEIHPIIDRVGELLNEGRDDIIVEVPKGELTRRARAKLDTLITREIITEDQGRDVRFSAYDADAAVADALAGQGTAVADPAFATLPPPAPAEGTVNVDDGDSFLDPSAVLTGGLDFEEDRPMDTSADVVQQVEIDAEGNEVTAEGDFGGDDFLDPGTPAAATGVLDVPTPPEMTVPAAEGD